jgi:hypothetical protein
MLKKKLFDYMFRRKLFKLFYIEESFFLFQKLEREIKLTQELLHLNYLKLSPYPLEKTNLTAILEEKSLYLWFYNDNSIRKVPEALLLYRYFNKKYSDGIFIMKSKKDKAIVLKDNTLVASFSKEKIAEFDVKLALDKFYLEKKQVFYIENNEYEDILHQSFDALKFQDILQLLNISFDISDFFKKAISFTALPLLISTIILSLLLFAYNSYNEVKYEELFNIYKEKQKKTVEIKDEAERYEDYNKVYENLSKEFSVGDKTVALFKIIEEAKKQNLILAYIRMNDADITFEVRTTESEKIPVYVKALFASELFTDVKNTSTVKIKKSQVKVTMQAILNERL